MFSPIRNSLIVAASVFSLVACSQQQESPKSQKVRTKLTHLRDTATNAPTRTPENEVISCEEIWAGFVAANPLGYSKTYQATTVTEYTGGEGLPAPETVVETSTDTVTASSDISVSLTYEYTTSAQPEPAPAEVETLTKAEFLTQCNAPAPVEPAPAPAPAEPNAPAEPQPKVEVTDEGKESLTVQAGVFDTDFVKAKVTQTGEDASVAIVGEWYITGTDFLVKSTYQSTAQFDAISIITTQNVELIRLVNPAAAPAAH